MPTEDATGNWEDEGGALGHTDCPSAVEETADASSIAVRRYPIVEQSVGTIHPAVWAEQIRARLAGELDRVAKMLDTASGEQPEQDRKNTQDIVKILEQRRAELMARNDAGDFIHDWQELRDQVRQMILEDPRYQSIKVQPFSILP
ncbi:MAG TPA: hypothetical protein VH681_00540 [Nitrospiraceae bacterium]|jgi:hypothetical protein